LFGFVALAERAILRSVLKNHCKRDWFQGFHAVPPKSPFGQQVSLHNTSWIWIWFGRPIPLLSADYDQELPFVETRQYRPLPEFAARESRTFRRNRGRQAAI